MEDDTPPDPVTMYLQEVATIIPLTKEEEVQLFRKLGTSGNWNEEQELVARRLIETHLKLVVDIAEKHASSGIPMLELVQEGNLGLMNALRNFADKPQGDFRAFATTRIEEFITKAIEKR